MNLEVETERPSGTIASLYVHELITVAIDPGSFAKFYLEQKSKQRDEKYLFCHRV